MTLTAIIFAGILTYFTRMTMIALIKDNFSKYSDKTAPYNRCREFIIPTEATATKLDAPPDNNCKNTICEAPPKMMKDIA